MAIPVDLQDRNLYVSYNFEANYVLPAQSTDFTQGFFDKILLLDGVDEAEDENFARMTESLGFLSRRNVYRMIEQKIETFKLDGRACLLRMICEVAAADLVETNGVFGSLLHVLFT